MFSGCFQDAFIIIIIIIAFSLKYYQDFALTSGDGLSSVLCLEPIHYSAQHSAENKHQIFYEH